MMLAAPRGLCRTLPLTAVVIKHSPGAQSANENGTAAQVLRCRIGHDAGIYVEAFSALRRALTWSWFCCTP